MNTDRMHALANQLEHSTNFLEYEKEALRATESFQDFRRVFELLARGEMLGMTLHKKLVAWHTQYPDRPSLAETDSFWAELKELRAVKEELNSALLAIKEKEKTRPTLKSAIEHATNEAGDVEKHFSSYLDRINDN